MAGLYSSPLLSSYRIRVGCVVRCFETEMCRIRCSYRQFFNRSVASSAALCRKQGNELTVPIPDISSLQSVPSSDATFAFVELSEAIHAPDRYTVGNSDSNDAGFIEQQIQFIARHLPPRQLSFWQMFQMQETAPAAELLQEELLRRYAQRVTQLDKLEKLAPGCLTTIPELQDVRDVYAACFQTVRPLSVHHLTYFNCVVRSLKRRHQMVATNLITGMRQLKKLLNNNTSKTGNSSVDNWMDYFLHQFFLSRISTELLREQYLTAIDSGNPSGLVSNDCKIVPLVRNAAKSAVDLCRYHLGVAPRVMITLSLNTYCHNNDPSVCSRGDDSLQENEDGNGTVSVTGDRSLENKFTFACAPQFLYSAVFELVKNALRSTVETSSLLRRIQENVTHAILPPVLVQITWTSGELLIEVRDEGGGIEWTEQPKLWSFLYTTAEEAHTGTATGRVPALAGCGVGLPLCKLYLNYLGGDVWVDSIPRKGTSAFLRFRNITTDWTEQSSKLTELLPPLCAGQ
eukprot:GHVQ01023971.1.p1 GENE.GHVQ01023971.1~~GHVQ01023971.1.p1  ORF type:complete len:515 (-),score=40.02 GHVQ01023971.1:450-1994(-)